MKKQKALNVGRYANKGRWVICFHSKTKGDHTAIERRPRRHCAREASRDPAAPPGGEITGDREPGTETATQESRSTQAMPESKTQAWRPRSQQRERPSESEGGEGTEGPAPVATGDYDSDHSLSTCTIPHASHSPLIFPTRQVRFTDGGKEARRG